MRRRKYNAFQVCLQRHHFGAVVSAMRPMMHLSPKATTMALSESYVVLVPIMTIVGALLAVLRRGLPVGLRVVQPELRRL
jgi:hypothetical protein